MFFDSMETVQFTADYHISLTSLMAKKIRAKNLVQVFVIIEGL